MFLPFHWIVPVCSLILYREIFISLHACGMSLIIIIIYTLSISLTGIVQEGWSDRQQWTQVITNPGFWNHPFLSSRYRFT